MGKDHQSSLTFLLCPLGSVLAACFSVQSIRALLCAGRGNLLLLWLYPSVPPVMLDRFC